MRRITALIITIMMILCMSMPLSVAAATDDHGANAHSESMSVDSGDEPIADKSTTKDTGKPDAGDVYGKVETEAATDEDETADEEASEEGSVEQPIEDVEEAKDMAKGSLLNGMKKMFADNPVIWIAGIAVISIGAVVAEIMVTKRRQKAGGGKPSKKKGSDKHYKGKH